MLNQNLKKLPIFPKRFESQREQIEHVKSQASDVEDKNEDVALC
jgi:hypothetical protein